MNYAELEITRELLIKAKKIALRNGRWFKLHPIEKAVLTLTSRVVARIRSRVLKKIIINILEKISISLIIKFKVLTLGSEIAKKRVKQAIKLGYHKAKDWLEEFDYIWYLGWSQVNEPVQYVYEGGMF